jgi:hypothetical protein
VRIVGVDGSNDRLLVDVDASSASGYGGASFISDRSVVFTGATTLERIDLDGTHRELLVRLRNQIPQAGVTWDGASLVFAAACEGDAGYYQDLHAYVGPADAHGPACDHARSIGDLGSSTSPASRLAIDATGDIAYAIYGSVWVLAKGQTQPIDVAAGLATTSESAAFDPAWTAPGVVVP